MPDRDFERGLIREYGLGKQTLLDEFGNPMPKKEAMDVLGATFTGITARQAGRAADHLSDSFLVGISVAGEKTGTAFAFDEVNRRHLNRITKETIGKIGEFNHAAMGQIARKYAEIDYQARTVNLLSEMGWNKTVEDRLKKMGLTPDELDIIKHQTTTNKMVAILEQRGMRAGIHPDQVARELRPYVRGFFDGGEKVVIDNTGRIRKVLQVNADGRWKFVDKVVTRPYTTNVKAYSRLVARHSMAEAQNTGYMAGFEESGLAAGWVYMAVMDSNTRPEHAMLHGKRFKMGEGPMPPFEVNCRCLPEIDPKEGSGIRGKSDSSFEKEKNRYFFEQKAMKEQKVPSRDLLKKGTMEKMPTSESKLREIRKEVLGL